MANSVFVTNIEQDTLKNQDYRRVISTTKHQQLVLMSIKPGDNIKFEIHPDNDQFIRVEQGTAVALVGANKDEKYELVDGSIIVVPAGTYHQIINTSKTQDLKLYTIYSPPHHPADRVEKTNPDKPQIGSGYYRVNLHNKIY